VFRVQHFVQLPQHNIAHKRGRARQINLRARARARAIGYASQVWIAGSETGDAILSRSARDEYASRISPLALSGGGHFMQLRAA